MGSASYLYTLADTIRDQALLGIAAARTGVAVPTKVYVSHGDPAADPDGCGCTDDGATYGGGILAVSIGSPTGDPIDFTVEGPRAQCHLRPRATFTVTLLRCVPALNDDGTAPDGSTLEDSAQQLLIDLWCLTTWMLAARAAGDLGADACDVKLGDTEQLAPEGGCAGWRLTVTVNLSDTGPTGS